MAVQHEVNHDGCFRVNQVSGLFTREKLNRHPFALPLILAVLILAALSCSKKDSSPTGPSPDSDWTIGSPSTIQVSSTSAAILVDQKTGTSFYLPNGGSGTLSVAPISSAPSTGAAIVQEFHVEYTGTDEVRVKFTHQGDTIGALYYYGSAGSSCVDDSCKSEDWWPVTEWIDDGTTTQYRLPLIGTALPKRQGFTPPTASNFAYAKIAPGSTDAALLALYRQTVDQVTDLWIQNLPSSLQQTMRTRSKALGYTINLVNAGNAYRGNNSILFSNSSFFFTRRIELRGIAHETGHRMTHVLLGYNNFIDLYNRFPQTILGTQLDHEPGKLWTRAAGMVEDYAYFSEYLATGFVDNMYDYSNVAKTNNFADVTNNASASSVDYPAHEGFSTAMAIALLRSANTIYSFDTRSYSNGLKVSVPVINAPIPDVLGIFARGPRTVDEMQSFIQDYLTGVSPTRQFSMPAMYQPLGWSYNGMGRILDDNSQPIAGATIQNICQDGSTVYGFRTFASTPTGTDGKYYIHYMYPGTSILRVFTNMDKDSTDFTVTIDWTKPTNTTFSIPDLKVAQSTPSWAAVLPRMLTVDGYIDASMKDTNGNVVSLRLGNEITCDSTEGNVHLTWNGTKFSAQWNYKSQYYDTYYQGSISGSVSTAAKTVSFTGSSTITSRHTFTQPFFDSTVTVQTKSFTLSSVPWFNYSSGNSMVLDFEQFGITAASCITSFNASYTYTGWDEKGIQLSSSSQTISKGDLVINSNSSIRVSFIGK